MADTSTKGEEDSSNEDDTIILLNCGYLEKLKKQEYYEYLDRPYYTTNRFFKYYKKTARPTRFYSRIGYAYINQ